MKKLIAVLVAVVAVSAATSAHAAQPVKSSLLSKMGLSKMQVMSDSEGTSVRGMGVNVGGASLVVVSGRHSVAIAHNDYDANGRHFAAGITVSGAINSRGTWAVAGGVSAAVAH